MDTFPINLIKVENYLKVITYTKIETVQRIFLIKFKSFYASKFIILKIIKIIFSRVNKFLYNLFVRSFIRICVWQKIKSLILFNEKIFSCNVLSYCIFVIRNCYLSGKWKALGLYFFEIFYTALKKVGKISFKGNLLLS